MNILSSISYTPPLYNEMLKIAADTISTVDPRILSVVAGVGLGIMGSQLFLQSNNQRPQIETSLEKTENSPVKSSWFQNKWNSVNWKYVGAGAALAGLGLSFVAAQAFTFPSQKPQMSPTPQSESNPVNSQVKPPFEYDDPRYAEVIRDILAIKPTDGHIDTYVLYKSEKYREAALTCAAFKFIYENPNFVYNERRGSDSPVLIEIKSQEDLERINKNSIYAVNLQKFRTYDQILRDELEYSCKKARPFG